MAWGSEFFLELQAVREKLENRREGSLRSKFAKGED